MKALISLALALTVLPTAGAAAAAGTAQAPLIPARPQAAAVPLAGTPAAFGQHELHRRVERLTARARAHARRLGLATDAMGGVPTRPDLLARREQRLTAVISFLSRRREVGLAVDERRSARPRAGGRSLTAKVVRQHSLAVRRALRLGVDHPGRLRLAATPAGRRAQLARWRSVARWLGARRERVRPRERPLSQRLRRYDALMCIAEHESRGTWDISTGNGYYGGLQMDRSFQQAYAPRLYRTKGTADNWTKEEQMRTAQRAIATRGFHPWPTTARTCGLL